MFRNPRGADPDESMSTISSMSVGTQKDAFGLDDSQYSALAAAISAVKEKHKKDILATLSTDDRPVSSAHSDTSATSGTSAATSEFGRSDYADSQVTSFSMPSLEPIGGGFGGNMQQQGFGQSNADE